MQITRTIKNLLVLSPFLGSAFSMIAQTPIYRACVYHNIRKYAKNIRNSKRYTIIIELTTICNAKCIMCPHPIMKREKKVMDDETFEILLRRLKEENIVPLAFLLSGFGEPLADRKIFERIRTLRKEFSGSITKFYSNFGLANEDIIHEIIASGLDEINISFQGYTKQQYEGAMGISYESTLDNLNSLIEKRNESKSKLKIRLSMALMKDNERDRKSFINCWQRKVDSVSINRAVDVRSLGIEISGRNRIHLGSKPSPCKVLWNTIVVSVSGDIFLCCVDFEGKCSFGNIRKNKLLDMFYSQKFEEMRRLHLNNDITKTICANCYGAYGHGAEWLLRDVY